MTDYNNKILDGYLKAFALLANRNARRQQEPPKRPRYVCEPGGVALHLAQSVTVLTPEENALDAAGFRQSLPPKLLRRVPLKRGLYQNYGKTYPAHGAKRRTQPGRSSMSAAMYLLITARNDVVSIAVE